jgi:hypothetical protein
MVELFASVGARRFDLTHTNLDQERRGFRRAQTLEQIRGCLPHLIPSSFRRQNNVIIRPHSDQAAIIQLDDLTPANLARVQEAAFMVIETSPGNFQAWVAVEGAEDKEFARRLRKGTGADESASGATRIAGTRNHKRKYAPAFPLVTVTAKQPGRTVTRQALEGAGLVAAPEPPRPPRASPSRSSKGARWPSYARCLADAPAAHAGEKADISRADFAWCVIAIDWGHSIEEVAARLIQESEKAARNGPGYADLTAKNAAEVVAARGQGPSLS